MGVRRDRHLCGFWSSDPDLVLDLELGASSAAASSARGSWQTSARSDRYSDIAPEQDSAADLARLAIVVIRNCAMTTRAVSEDDEASRPDRTVVAYLARICGRFVAASLKSRGGPHGER